MEHYGILLQLGREGANSVHSFLNILQNHTIPYTNKDIEGLLDQTVGKVFLSKQVL